MSCAEREGQTVTERKKGSPPVCRILGNQGVNEGRWTEWTAEGQRAEAAGRMGFWSRTQRLSKTVETL
jgi:hypothetical protein